MFIEVNIYTYISIYVSTVYLGKTVTITISTPVVVSSTGIWALIASVTRPAHLRRSVDRPPSPSAASALLFRPPVSLHVAYTDEVMELQWSSPDRGVSRVD
jgi:hypothetical protein